MTESNLKAAPAAFTTDLVARLLAACPPQRHAEPVAPAPVRMTTVSLDNAVSNDVGKIVRAAAGAGLEVAFASPLRPARKAKSERSSPNATAPAAPPVENGYDTHSPVGKPRPRGVLTRSITAPNGDAPARSVTTAPDWIGRRHHVFRAAEAYLKARCILVSPVDRDALVRTYRVSGRRESQTLEMVIAYAEALGFEVPA